MRYQALGITCLAILIHCSCSGTAEPFNVLIVSLDTTRKDHLSCYGYERLTTPTIDRLAEESLLFTRAVAVSNWTLPTHASMLTGLYPPSHGAHHVSRAEPHVEHVNPAGKMSDAPATLAEILAEQGYRTGAVLANWWWLGRPYGLDRGFEHYDHRIGSPPSVYRRAESITGEALDWLGRDDARPFFLLLNYMDPHIPYHPPAPFDSRFLRREPEERAPTEWGPFAAVQEQVLVTGRPLNPLLRDLMIDLYDGELAYVDDQIRRLLEALKDTGEYERTLIIVTADHGEAFGEHLAAGHGLLLHEAEVAVPLIVKLPYSRSFGKKRDLVQHVDLMPTVLDVLGLPESPASQGRSILESGRGEAYVMERTRESNAKLSAELGRDQWALYSGDLKYIEYSDGERQLHDLVEDPQELQNLVESRSGDAARLRTLLEAWRDRTPRPVPQLPDGDEPDAETLERLKSLGYVN
jgi:arylsulfatase A-like enzyme